MKKQTDGKQSFTLVELLVVISIIAVLSALLLPALKSANDRAKAAQCASNEKQVGVGWAAYLNDHNGYYPYQSPECPFGPTNGCPDGTIWDPESGQLWRPSYAGGSCSWGNWQMVLTPYLGGPIANNAFPNSFVKLMRCQANPWPFTSGADAYYAGNAFSYMLNVCLIPMSWRCGGASSCGVKPNNPAGWSKRTNMNDIHNSSSAALMLENPVCPGSWARSAAGGYLVDNPWTRLNGPPGNWLSTVPMPFPSGVGYGVNSSVVTNITGIIDSRYTYAWLRPDCNYAVSAFHGLGMNVLFFDGHVARVPKTTLFSYTYDVEVGHYWVATPNPNSSPGGLFWTDGVGINGVDSNGNEYNIFGANQFPGYQVQP